MDSSLGVYCAKWWTTLDLETFFNSDAVALPRRGFDDSKADFGSYLNDVFKGYLSQVALLDDPSYPDIVSFAKDSSLQIADLAASILTAVHSYLCGNPLVAYDEVDRMLQDLNLSSFLTDLQPSLSPLDPRDPFSIPLASIFQPAFYRIRAERNEFMEPDRRDIFHVPFEKRRHVGNQRYSITGLPCLYLGSSLWVCWEELGRPAFDSVWVSRFRLAESIKILDFQFPPHHVWRIFDALQKGAPNAMVRVAEERLKASVNLEFLKSYLLLWPLIASCSIRPETQGCSFCPEYILSQALLQWVVKGQSLDGIRYFSVRTPPKGRHIYAHSNLVLPTRTYSKSGVCSHLRKRFHLTAPISWELLEAINLGEQIPDANASANPFAFVQANQDLPLGYSQTTFSRIEKKLEQIESMGGCSREVED